MHVHPDDEGEHGHEHEDEHGHEHEDEHGHEHESEKTASTAGSTKAGYGLVAVIGLSPCVALLPIVFGATTLGTSSVVTIMVVFFIATMATILILTGLAVKGLQFIKLGFIEKHGEVFTGLVIAFMGILVVGMGL